VVGGRKKHKSIHSEIIIVPLLRSCFRHSIMIIYVFTVSFRRAPFCPLQFHKVTCLLSLCLCLCLSVSVSVSLSLSLSLSHQISACLSLSLSSDICVSLSLPLFLSLSLSLSHQISVSPHFTLRYRLRAGNDPSCCSIRTSWGVRK
jgi:hypothetical protein